MGLPEMKKIWDNLAAKHDNHTLNKKEARLFKKLVKTLRFLSENPQHNSLRSHEIEALSRRYGMKVWQSYLENNTPGAGRLYWVYGPDRGEITIIGLEPHPENSKRSAYTTINLSDLP